MADDAHTTSRFSDEISFNEKLTRPRGSPLILDTTGELIAALILIIGGVGLTGYASLIGGVA